MKFLIDAQLPARLSRLLIKYGHDSIHTAELPLGNRSSDDTIAAVADREHRVVVSKDRDFRDAHLLHETPRSLLIVHTGNIANNDLLDLFAEHLNDIECALQQANLVELRNDRLIVHADRPVS